MTRPRKPAWDFDYRPIRAQGDAGVGPCDVVLATRARIGEDRAREAFARLAPLARVDEILAIAPLFWLRVRGPAPLAEAEVAAIGAGLGEVRYVTSAQRGSQAWAPPFAAVEGVVAGEGWPARPATEGDVAADEGPWYLSADGGGVAVRREVTGTGAGARLAVIDDDGADTEALALDAEVLVNVARRSSAQKHGALMVGWAVGAPRAEPPFRGVAPDASPRLYLIPKPGADVLSLPLALVRAVADGADVAVCATYLEGGWSPLLDDALAFAERLGRGGLGTVVVMPTGRETSSPPGSVHASFALSFGDPAADPRVLCVGPGGRRGGWFFYRDRKKLARPFGNRGPAVRLLAPGDDLPYPLGGAPRLSHAESSGASAVAAGVALLLLANNPSLRLREVLALLESTAGTVDPAPDPAWAPFADPYDTLPLARDRDGHNAKHGYGALSAERACLAAADPVTWALVSIGESGAACAFLVLRRGEPALRAAWSDALARWMVRALLGDARAGQAARAIARHVRLLAASPQRAADFPPGTLARQIALLLRGLLEGAAVGTPPEPLRRELEALLGRLGPSAEAAWIDLATRAFSA